MNKYDKTYLLRCSQLDKCHKLVLKTHKLLKNNKYPLPSYKEKWTGGGFALLLSMNWTYFILDCQTWQTAVDIQP